MSKLNTWGPMTALVTIIAVIVVLVGGIAVLAAAS